MPKRKLHPVQRNVRGYAAVGFDNPKSPLNLGSALRACAVYDAAMLAYTGRRFQGAPTDTPKQYRHMPLLHPDDLREVIPFDCIPVAVDLIEGARPLNEYSHPERAFYIFGAEDQTLGKRITDWCRDTVYVPTNGCMNLAATVNVVLYDRMAKRMAIESRVAA